MKLSHFFVLLCSLLVLSACATETKTNTKKPVVLTGEEADIYDAVIRHEFSLNASATQHSAGSYFIQIQQADPTDAFLLRFASRSPQVKRASEARYGRDSAIYDRSNGRMSLMFHAGPIRWRDKNTVEVDGGYYEGNLSSSESIYRLVRIRKKWKVVKETLSWISDIRKGYPTDHNT